VLGACAKTGRGTPADSGLLRIGIQGSPDTLQPLLTSDTTDKMIGRLLFDPLISVDASGRHDVPILAAEVPTLATAASAGMA